MRVFGNHTESAQPLSCDIAYRRVTTRLGAVLMVFSALFIGLDMLVDAVVPLISRYTTAVGKLVVRELLDSAAYLLSFMLPVSLLRFITPPEERCSLPLSPVLPRRIGLVLPAGLALIYTAAMFNAFLMRQLGWQMASTGSSVAWDLSMSVYEGVLLLISAVLVPAFCEELLFRGAVLSALRPYGRTVAVLGSAVLFGLMHATPGQLLYTTIAGVVLALIVLESGSIWGSVLLHVMNNLFAILENILEEQLSPTASMQVYSMLEVLLIGGGLLCLCVLIHRQCQCPQQPTREAEVVPIHPVRGFLTPLMLAFVVFSLGQIAWLILLAAI